jgi:hypothetical protein
MREITGSADVCTTKRGKIKWESSKKSMKKANAPWNEPIHESRGLAWAMALYGALDILGSSKLKGLWHVQVASMVAMDSM